MGKIFFGTILFLSGILLQNNGYSQQAIAPSNVHWRIIGKKIEIFYDLPHNKDSLEVKVIFLKKSNPQFGYVPRVVSGSIGKGVFSGKSRKIVWQIKNEPASLFTGDGYYFVVKVKKIDIQEF